MRIINVNFTRITNAKSMTCKNEKTGRETDPYNGTMTEEAYLRKAKRKR